MKLLLSSNLGYWLRLLTSGNQMKEILSWLATRFWKKKTQLFTYYNFLEEEEEQFLFCTFKYCSFGSISAHIDFVQLPRS